MLTVYPTHLFMVMLDDFVDAFRWRWAFFVGDVAASLLSLGETSGKILVHHDYPSSNFQS